MKRAVVFAHYDKDSVIDDYVVYYVENLKKVADIVVFVSCNNLSEEEKQKLEVNHIISEEHEEYDFGSYKRGFLYLKDNKLLDDADELIFANDSCYAPLFPFEEMFDKMEKEDCDFWGITKNKYGLVKINNSYKKAIRPHLQSYFIAFKREVLSSECFAEFVSKIMQLNCKNDIIINYEIGLSEYLISNGFQYATYINDSYKKDNLTLYKWKELITKYRIPTVKCSVIRGINFEILYNYECWEEVLRKYTKYPINLIHKNLQRTEMNLNPFVKWGKRFIYLFKCVGRKIELLMRQLKIK